MKLFTHVAFLMLFALPLFASAQTTPLRILEKPKPERPKDTGHIEGVVRIRVTFLASGRIGDVIVVIPVTKELGELAAAAAKKIKFEPKIVDGVPVSVAMIVEYAYREGHGGWGGSAQQSKPPAVEGPTTPLRIVEKPKPELPKDYGTLDVEGVFRLKVEFLASGKVGKISIVSELTKELSELAIAAAKIIKFEPKKVHGVPVDSSFLISDQQGAYLWTRSR